MGLSWGCSHPSLTVSPSLCTLLHDPAQLRVVGPDQPVTATVGQDVVLPCHLSPQRDARSLEVRWIRDKFSETVHHYRNGEDLYGEQMGAYAGRTELVRDGLSSGRLDLRITGLRPSDDGQYICTVKNADAYDEATVHLVEIVQVFLAPALVLSQEKSGDFLLSHYRGRCALGCPLLCFHCPCWAIFRSQEVPHLLPRGAAPGPE
uniref:Ig-like domain-containing protein n=1 Tax=Anas platyrhynchos platyrhynchos TaxID=8840 RepID=A0A493T4S2_ANAPP